MRPEGLMEEKTVM